jgi:hypothetical protein
MSFGSNGVDRVRSLPKIPKQLRLANLCVNCTCSACFAPSLCSNEMVRNTLKHEFWVKWGGWSAFVVKNSDAISFSKFVW